MAAGDDVSVKLGVDAKQAENDLKGFEGTLKGFAGSIKSTLGGFAAGFAGAFSLDAIKQVITQTIHYGSTIQDLSERFHISTGAVQRYKLAAEQTGASLEVFSKAFQKLEVNKAKALGGDTKTQQKFEAAGISLKQLQGQSDEETFDAVARSGLDAAQAVALLGKNALELRPLFEAIQAGTANLNGAIISPEDIALLDKFDDTLLSIAQTLHKIAAVIITESLPAMADFINKAIAGIGPIKAYNEFVRRTDKTPQGEAAADVADTELASIAKRHREEAGLAAVPDTATTSSLTKEDPKKKIHEKEKIDKEKAKDEKKFEREAKKELDDAEKTVLDEIKHGQGGQDEQKRDKEQAAAQEKLRQAQFKRDNAEEIRNPGSLTLHDIATSNILGPERAKAQEAERAEADAKRHQLSGEKGLAQQDRARADKLKEQLGVKGPKDEFKDALNESEVLKKIEKNTGGGAANK